MVLFLLVHPALSAGYSLDIELLRPSPTPDHVFGVDGPMVVAPRELRMITFAQLENDPLVVYEFGEEAGTVVGTRNAWHIGASYGLYKHVALRTVLPMAVQWGADTEEAAASTAGGLGDWSAGLTWQVVERSFGSLGLRTDFYAPTSPADSYLGETDPRFEAGLLASLEGGPVKALLDTTLMSRALVATDKDLDLGSELTTTAALRFGIHPKADVGVSALTRTGIGRFLQGGETPMELVGGFQLHPGERVQVDVGGGRGVLEGYGTTTMRWLLGVTLRAPPPERVVVIPPPPPNIVPIPTAPEAEEDAWDPQRLVQITAELIDPTDPIRFRVDTAEILPESLPALDATAALLADHDEITLVAIEGHASEEGTYEHNYALSTERSLAIYRALIERGIHPDRLALRPWGERKPLATGATEDELRKNRAVVFVIESRRFDFEPTRDYGSAFTSPIDGKEIPIAAPTTPPTPPPPAIDPSMFDPDE